MRRRRPKRERREPASAHPPVCVRLPPAAASPTPRKNAAAATSRGGECWRRVAVMGVWVVIQSFLFPFLLAFLGILCVWPTRSTKPTAAPLGDDRPIGIWTYRSEVCLVVSTVWGCIEEGSRQLDKLLRGCCVLCETLCRNATGTGGLSPCSTLF